MAALTRTGAAAAAFDADCNLPPTTSAAAAFDTLDACGCWLLQPQSTLRELNISTTGDSVCSQHMMSWQRMPACDRWHQQQAVITTMVFTTTANLLHVVVHMM